MKAILIFYREDLIRGSIVSGYCISGSYKVGHCVRGYIALEAC